MTAGAFGAGALAAGAGALGAGVLAAGAGALGAGVLAAGAGALGAGALAAGAGAFGAGALAAGALAAGFGDDGFGADFAAPPELPLLGFDTADFGAAGLLPPPGAAPTLNAWPTFGVDVGSTDTEATVRTETDTCVGPTGEDRDG